MAIVKKLKQHPPLPPSRYEVGIYCRVSTASKTQVVSAGHQLSGLIADVAHSQQARLYDVYLDVQSGRTSDNRKNLMRLLDDCRAGRVTLVYTKSISRFARNTVDVLTIVRELKKMNVPVYFENEQLYSFDKEAELAISLHGAIAQGESENKSENIKWSLVINDPEAEVIRQIFQMYLDGYSIGGIKKYLEEKGILTSRGRSTWSKRTIETILANEKYVGDVILYKTFSPNFPEKKRIPNNGEHQKYIQEDHHPSIISREMFRAVQEMRESRSNIERHADGTVTRKAKRYTGKKE
ncbi:recombinase family protein [Oliverpabstia intestinalis]|uniref:recombinase family protein n=1 Tax=Oliverpabstia intestinalis TaxID=2606633 RepID=UPI003F894AA8